MFGLSWTKLILLLFVAYLVNTVYVIYTLFSPESCDKLKYGSKCIEPSYTVTDLEQMKITVYVSRSSTPKQSDMKLMWDSGKNNVLETATMEMNVSIPFSTRRNGSLFAYVFLHAASKSPFDKDSRTVYRQHALTKYAIPRDSLFNLMQGSQEKKTAAPITHMHTKLAFYVAVENVTFKRQSIPPDLYHLISVNQNGKYLPLLHVDGLTTLDRHMVPITKNTSEVPLHLYYTPVSLGRLRIWTAVEMTLKNFKNLGFSDKDIDEVKGIFTDTNLYFLGLTFFVALVHMLFDILAFKNDVSFWKNKESMTGMSTRTVIWRCVSTTIIFLYLLDEKTSLLVLVPAGVGALIELWKVKKALKISITFTSWKPSLTFGEKSKSEKETEEIDEQAMKYLSYALYPLLAASAFYSLIYQPHKSWYSWVVKCLVNGVYAFGFLFMLPQLFVNYKLKSVAHLPWRAFMYKAFNTFIDDVFAFIITMPTAHRLACFRDDIVFLVYLYQRWLYPVDKSRTNEYGMTFEPPKENQEIKDSNEMEEKENNDEQSAKNESKKDQ